MALKWENVGGGGVAGVGWVAPESERGREGGGRGLGSSSEAIKIEVDDIYDRLMFKVENYAEIFKFSKKGLAADLHMLTASGGGSRNLLFIAKIF